MTEIEILDIKKTALEAENRYLKSLLSKEKRSFGSKIKEMVKDVVRKPDRIRIGLVVDVENWAFANIANNFKKHLPTEYEALIVPMSLIDSDVLKMWLMLGECDIVHFFCRGLPTTYKSPELKEKIQRYGDTYENFYKNYLKGKVLTACVYDHLFLDDDFSATQYWFSEVDTYYVSSGILKKIYDGLDIKYKPTAVITDGVDLELFYPKSPERFDDTNRTITIGWVGNSDWNKGTDHKGINTVIRPAVENLKNRGYNVELLTSDKVDRHIPISEMVNYYEKIDLYVCASVNEGTPNPVLESMACGVPVISTDVGIVRDALGEVQSRFILKERSVSCFENAIAEMIDTPSLMKKCSLENLESIKRWDWKYKAKDFEQFIQFALKKGKKI